MPSLKLANSPRLYVDADIVANLKDNLHSPFLRTAAQRVIRDADWLVETPPVLEREIPSYLGVGRWLQSHLECLTCAWLMTRDGRYRTAAIKHLATLLKFDHISCEANASVPAEVEMPFCLTYGEQSQAIGMMYDVFRPDMTSTEQKVFFDVVNRFHMKEAVKCLEKPPWWANTSWSNWNGVCAGGIGLMALAMYDDMPQARRLIPFVEKSLDPYFKSYIDSGGGCDEGTGYWNYGMNYSMRYVLSWEKATRKKHPALRIKQLGKSLMFPLDFTGITFGDNDGWHPAAFYFLLAKRLKMPDAALNAATHLPDKVDPDGPRRQKYATSGDILYCADAIPTTRQIKRLRVSHSKKKVPVARVYEGMDWAVLADDEAFPKLRMSVRGGSSAVKGHGFVDLLSFRCRVNNELMITDQRGPGYLTTTFTRRGSDIYSRSPASKSTLFVEGLGCDKDVVCDKTEVVKGNRYTGIRIDATHIYMPRMPVSFIGRLFLFVENEYWLIVDHVLSRNAAIHLGIESRFHTYAEYKRKDNYVSLKSGREKMQMTFAAMQSGVLQEAIGMPAMPRAKPSSILRWMGKDRKVDNLHVVALNPGSKKLDLALSKEKGNIYVIEVTKPGSRRKRIRLSSTLQPR